MTDGRALGLFAAAASLAAAALAVSCSENHSATAERKETGDPPRSVRVAPAARVSLPRVVTVSGTLAAMDQAVLGMKVAGRLEALDVDLGSRVAAGDPLARLVTTDFDLRVRQAEAAVEQARSRLGLPADSKEVRVDPEKTSIVRQARAVLNESRLARDRAQTLWEQQLMPRSQLDSAEADFQVAEGRCQDALDEVVNREAILAQRLSELDLARQQLEDTLLAAPFPGAIRARHASPGEYLAAGQPVVTLVRVDPLRLRVAVPEREAAAVRVGQSVRLGVEGDPRTYQGKVARVSPAIEEGSRTLMVEAEVANHDGDLRPGAFATAEIVTTSDQPAIFVPASAIVTFAGIEKVILVQEGRAVERRVRTGRRQQGQVEIVEGLEAGEPVVVEPGSLAGGQAAVATE